MDLKAWIEEIKKSDKDLAGVSEKQIRSLLKHLFASVKSDIGSTEKGAVKLRGLGSFRVSQKERKNKEGGEGKVPVKKVALRLKSGEKKGKGGGKGKGGKRGKAEAKGA